MTDDAARDEHYRVLVIEDNELDARSIIRSLADEATRATYVVERASDLASGLAAIDTQVFDCVLLDLSLPDSEGLVSVEIVVGRSQNCPVVVLTGLDDPATAVESVARGAQDYLVKGALTPELVARSIRYAVTRHSSESELRHAQARLSDMASREQIARDLHDTVIQRLFAAGLTLQASTSLTSAEAIKERAVHVVGEIDDAIRELREAIFGLHSLSEDETVAFELARLADSYEDTLGFAVDLRLGDVASVAPELHQDVLATVREALTNVAKHAEATAASVAVFIEGDELIVRVADNGRGVSEFASPGDLSGHGLRNMQRRAEAHGGSMTVAAGTDSGTELVWKARLSTV